MSGIVSDVTDEEKSVETERDPMVMYLVVRTSLRMNAGKTAAQVGHAVQSTVLLSFIYAEDVRRGHTTLDADGEIFRCVSDRHARFMAWLGEDIPSYMKIVLGASDAEFERVKACSEEVVLVIDRGFTTLPAGTETVVGLWPVRKSAAPDAVRNLKLLR